MHGRLACVGRNARMPLARRRAATQPAERPTLADATAMPKRATPKAKAAASTSAASWQKEMAYQLNCELKAENKRYAADKVKKLDEVRVTSFIRNGRLIPLLNYIAQKCKALRASDLALYEEMLVVTLKCTSSHLQRKAESAEWLASAEAATYVATLADTLAVMPLSSNDLTLMYCFNLMCLKEYRGAADLGARNDTFAAKLHELNQRVRVTQFHQDRLLLDTEDFERVCAFYDTVQESTLSEMPYLGYEENHPLVYDLMEPCAPSLYRGSPFTVPPLTRAKCLEMFRSQHEAERSYTIAVRNHARDSVEKPMEKVLDEWRWQETLASTFSTMRNRITNAEIKLYLAALDSVKVGRALLDSVKAALCQGKNVIGFNDLKFDLTGAVLALSHREFVDLLLSDNKKLYEKVCAEYFRYFDEERIARVYTCREWWYICAHRHNLKPDFEVPFADFTVRVSEELGVFLTDVVMNGCRMPDADRSSNRNVKRVFTFRNVTVEEESALDERGKKKIFLNKMIELNPKLIELINEHQFKMLLFPGAALPMTLPPRPWMDGGACGPHYTKSTDVLRNLYEFPDRNINVEMRKRLKNDVQGRPVFDALNNFGTTPWIVNKSMLKELIHAFDLTRKPQKKGLLKLLSVPMHRSTIEVPKHSDHFANKRLSEVPTAEWIAFSRRQHEASKEQNETNSLWCWLMYRIILANHFRDNILFFPHNMDFRGRVYPISPHLNHMGDDINRCLLKFARGKALGEHGLNWLKLHCVNLTGLLKRNSIADRMIYADANLDNMIASANEPWADGAWWLSSDEPWQTLAACMELRDVLAAGVPPAEFVSHLPIHQDGSCNGFQHYAALGRDEDGAFEVNLLPRNSPADIYSNVAKSVEVKRTSDERSDNEEVRELAADLRAFLPTSMPRAVIKQTVMTTVYGVTSYGARLQVRKQLKAKDIPSEKLLKFSTYISQKTLGSLNESFEASMKLKDWFRQCAQAIVKLMQPVEWVTPLGLPVMQPYLKPSKRHGHLLLTPVRHKQIDAFPPNYVHSLDSTHMMLTALQCRRRGVTFAAVHDCFWTHAADVDVMNEICREQFIRLHKQPLIEELGESFRRLYLENPALARMAASERAEFDSQLTNTVKRGSLDIEQIRKSVYFFS